jgi:carboxyl-terminal processing protease
MRAAKESTTMLKVARWTVLTLLAAAVIALAFSVGFVVNETHGGGSQPAGPAEAGLSSSEKVDFKTLNQILDILTKEYVEPDRLDARALYEAAINGLLKSLSDTGTFYVDPDTYRINVLPSSGTFEGIGATVSQQGGEIVIVAPIKGTPAEAAGIRSGDVILAVDGESTQGWAVDQAVLKIRGPAGTPVTLTIRHSDQTTEDITIVRDQIRVESVSTTPPGGSLKDKDGNAVTDIAYVSISEFTGRTDEELSPVLRGVSEDGYKGLILDLRGNPGGLLDATVGVADMFLDRGIILVEVSRSGDERVYNATGGGEAVDIPLVVLVDQFSASGSEVLSAAIQENGRGVLLGQKTFGKGTVNIARPLSDGGALFVSIARWLTPERIQIDGVGIQPNIEVALSDEDVNLRRDTQLLRAIDYLRSPPGTAEPTPVGTPEPTPVGTAVP